ncbi:MAG: CHAT domain-containing protein, partial [Planctomycetes bacterium]|nr:CHAT domain-containing protein [Planctomycetota bacterium]
MSDMTSKPAIFLAFANDAAGGARYLRNLGAEAKRIRSSLGQVDELCELVMQENATITSILDAFQQYRNRIAVFHYGGHADGFRLLLESGEGHLAAADGRGLAEFLGNQSGLQLVFLNGCSTEQQVDELLRANVSSVIATTQAVDDEVATEFGGRFYQGLASGATVATAYKEAAAAIKSAKGTDPRALYFGGHRPNSLMVADRWPWIMACRDGAEAVKNWNLPDAADNPLFGLPDLPEIQFPSTPFQFLKRFTRNEARVFFGRGYEIRDLYHKVIGGERDMSIILLYGQSGVGKSSLLDAGLVPRLESDYEVRYLRRSREGGLVDTLQLAFLPEAHGDSLGEAWQHKEKKLGKPLIVILDQVEEVFTRPNQLLPNELDEFLRTLRRIFLRRENHPAGKLILSFRKEWLPELETALNLHRLARERVFLDRLSRRGAIEAVRLSAEVVDHFGLEVDEKLPETIATDLLADRDSAVSPTLQVLLSTMWAATSNDDGNPRRFTMGLYNQLKTRGLHLGDFLDRQLMLIRKSDPSVVDSGLAYDVLAYHTTELGTAEQRTEGELDNAYGRPKDKTQALEQIAYGERRSAVDRLVRECMDNYLLVETSTDGGKRMTRLAHDTLGLLVRKRFDESDCPAQRSYRILRSRARDWEGDKAGTPLDEDDLSLVRAGWSAVRNWTQAEGRLISASLDAKGKRRESQRRRRFLLIALIVTTLLAGGISIGALAFMVRTGKDAQDIVKGSKRAVSKMDKESEEFRQLIADLGRYNAELNRIPGIWAEDPQKAREMLVDKDLFPEALRDFTWGYLHHQCGDAGTLLDAKHACSVAFSHDGSALIAGELNGRVNVWDVSSGNLKWSLTTDADSLRSICSHPSGPYFLTVSRQQSDLWDINKSEKMEIGIEGDFRGVGGAISSCGKFVALGQQRNVRERNVRVWSLESGDLLQEYEIRDFNGRAGISFSKDSQLLAAAGTELRIERAPIESGQDERGQDRKITYSCQLYIWELDSDTPVRKIEPDPMTHVSAIAFSPVSAKLAIAGGVGTSYSVVGLWSLPEGRLVWSQPCERTVTSLVFTEDGTKLFAGSYEGIHVRNTASGELISTYRKWSGTKDVDISPDGKTVAAAELDGVRLIPLALSEARKDAGDSRIHTITEDERRGDRDAYGVLAFSPDGHRLASATDRSIVKVWDVATGTLLHTIPYISDFAGFEDLRGPTIVDLTYIDNGRLAAASETRETFEGRIELIDIESGERTRPFDASGPATAIVSMEEEGSFAAYGRVSVFYPTTGTRTDQHALGVWKTDDLSAAEMAVPTDSPMYAIAWSGERRLIAVGGGEENDPRIRFWSLASKDWLQDDLDGHPRAFVRCMAFSPDGKSLISGGIRHVKVWDVEDRTLRFSLPFKGPRVFSVV